MYLKIIQPATTSCGSLFLFLLYHNFLFCQFFVTHFSNFHTMYYTKENNERKHIVYCVGRGSRLCQKIEDVDAALVLVMIAA